MPPFPVDHVLTFGHGKAGHTGRASKRTLAHDWDKTMDFAAWKPYTLKDITLQPAVDVVIVKGRLSSGGGDGGRRPSSDITVGSDGRSRDDAAALATTKPTIATSRVSSDSLLFANRICSANSVPCDASILDRDPEDMPCSYGQLAVLWLQDGSGALKSDVEPAMFSSSAPAGTDSSTDLPQIAPIVMSHTTGSPLLSFPHRLNAADAAPMLPAELVHDATCLRVAAVAAHRAAETLHPDTAITLRATSAVLADAVTGDSTTVQCCDGECPCTREVVPSGWVSVAALSRLRLAKVQVRQGQLVSALVSSTTAAMSALPSGATQLEALLLCAHLAGMIADSEELVPEGVFVEVGVSEAAALSPLHWLSEAVKYHPGSVEASLRFAASLTTVGQYDLAVSWMAKVRAAVPHDCPDLAVTHAIAIGCLRL